MNAIKNFDKANLKVLEAQVIDHLTALHVLTGVNFRFKGGHYTANVATLKLEISIPGSNGELPEELFFKQNAHFYNLTPEHLFRKFKTAAGETWKMEGLRDCRSKYRFIATRQSDGRRLVLTVPTVQTATWLS
jgi:hypothetical protein